MTRSERLARARRRAMRAAQAVTLGAVVGLSGCASAHGPGDASIDGATPDSGADAMMADAGCDPNDFSPTTEVCCDAVYGFWDAANMHCSVAVPGPFTPPSMDA